MGVSFFIFVDFHLCSVVCLKFVMFLHINLTAKNLKTGCLCRNVYFKSSFLFLTIAKDLLEELQEVNCLRSLTKASQTCDVKQTAESSVSCNHMEKQGKM